MSEQMNKFVKAWRKQWTMDLAEEVPQWPPHFIKLENSPPYPLARRVRISGIHGYETGALSFRTTSMVLSGLDVLEEVRSTANGVGSSLRLNLVFDCLRLSGKCLVEVKPDPLVEIDTAGNLMELPQQASGPVAAGADSGTSDPDPQKEEWLDQARGERTKLVQTDNGQKLLGLYNEHNETYESVFKTNHALIPLWQAGGATKEMAQHTSDSLKNDTTINDPNKLFSGDVTFNGNAFVQQLNVASACVWTDPDFNPETGPSTESKYWAAAKAALSFGKGVSTTTNNTKDNIEAINATGVYETVDKHDGTLPIVTDDEMIQVIEMGINPGGADAAVDLGWVVIDEHDRKRLRHLYDATIKQKAEDQKIEGKMLFQGNCEAVIKGVEAVVHLTRSPVGQEPSIKAVSAEIQLPAFDLDIDDSEWTGEAADIARSRIENMYFIRSLLHKSLVDHLQSAIPEAAEHACQLVSGAIW